MRVQIEMQNIKNEDMYVEKVIYAFARQQF